MIDIIIMCCFAVALYFSRAFLPAFAAYSAAVIYSNTVMFDEHSAAMNHLIYGLIFIPVCYFATLRLAAGLLAYSIFNLFVAIDWLIYPDAPATVISYVYDYVQVALAISLIFLGSRMQYNGIRNNYDDSTSDLNLCNIQTHQKTSQRR